MIKITMYKKESQLPNLVVMLQDMGKISVELTTQV